MTGKLGVAERPINRLGVNMNFKKIVYQASWLAASVLTAASVQAASLSLNTGVDAGGAVLAEGAADVTWTISVDGGVTFTTSQVNYAEQICCGMATVASTAAWVTDSGVAGSSVTGWGVGSTVFLRTTFDLSAFDLSSTALSGTWRVADSLVGIYLNGVELQGAIDDTWDTDRPIIALAGNPAFNQGLNTVEFRANSGNSRWDGLWVDATVRGADRFAVPEPTSALLSLAALGALALTRRRGS